MKDYVQCRICKKRFKRITTTHLKHHDMSVKEYQDKFGYDPSVLSCDSLREKYSITKDNLIKKYGDEDGEARWNSYCEKQRLTNTFEYKQKKYGWNKRQFNEYNKSRAVTKKNCIRRHGPEKGLEVWNNYVERQKYVGVKLEYFIEKYGTENGKLKYEDMLRRKIYTPNYTNNGIYYSAISYELFSKLDSKNSEFVFYGGKNNEYILSSGSVIYALDYFDVRTNKAIEFMGDYWHCNPSKYEESYFHSQRSKIAKEIWADDVLRINNIRSMFNIETLIIWESDYINNKEKIIRKCLDFLND
jgi:hypothetical protein